MLVLFLTDILTDRHTDISSNTNLSFIKKIIFDYSHLREKLVLISCAQLEMSALAGKQTFMMKILVRALDKRNKMKFFKKSHLPGSRGAQSQKSFLDLFFDRR